MNRTSLFATYTLAFMLAAGGLYADLNNDLLFYAPFDGSTTAAIAGGAPAATHAVAPRFEPGLRGQALVIGGDPDAGQRVVDGMPVADKTPRNSSYVSDGNIDLQQGSICFWIKPLDWRGADQNFNVLFYTSTGQNYFQIYKFFSDDKLLFLVGEMSRWTSTEFRSRDWMPGQWHHVAVTWSPDELRMALNGQLVCRRQVRFALRGAEPVVPFSVGPGGAWSHAFIGHSLVDEFRIYRRPLSLAEIQTVYLADAAVVEHDSGLITLGAATPQSDGRIEAYEYAFDSTGLAVPQQLLMSPANSRYALSYDREFLHLAVLADLHPTGSNGVELYLSPSADRMLSLVFTPEGRVCDAAGADMASVRVRHTVTNGVWLLEAAVPFDLSGAAAAPDGATWRLNLVRRYGAQMVSLAPVVGDVTNRQHFIALAFRPDAPKIKFGDWVDLTKQESAQAVSVKNAVENSAIRLDIINNTTLAYGLTSRSQTLFKDGRATPYNSPVWKLGADAGFNLSGQAIIETRDDKSTPLYVRKTITDISDPLKVFYIYTHDQRQLVVSSQKQAAGTMRVRFLRLDASEALRATQDLPADAVYFKAKFDLDFKALTPGNYRVAIDYVAPDGSASEIWQQAYVVPGPDHPAFHPYVDPECDSVPAPWTPVEVVDRSVDAGQHSNPRISIWGRTYGFGAGMLFDSLVSQGEEILAAPAVLRLDGAVLTPTAVETVVGPATAMRAALTRRADLGTVSIETRMVTHFDGYCEIDLELRPPDTGLKLQSLALDIPMRGAVAQMVRDAHISPVAGSKAGAIGDYWCQKFQGGQGGAYFWVGGGRVGLNWLVRDLDAWHNRTPAKQVELIREGSTLTVRLNLIDAPLTLDAPRTYRLGFTLTPSRPLDHKVLRRRENKDFQMWCQPWQYFAVPEYATASIPSMRDALARAEPGADELFLYLGVSLTSPFTPEWPWFVQEWLGPDGEYGKWTGSFRDPVLRDMHTYAGGPLNVDSFFNWLQNTRARFFERAKTPLIPEATGYYFDTGPRVDDRYREQALNVYRMIRRTGPRARIYTHQGMQRVMPMQHFTDIICGGEGLCDWVTQDGNYYRVLTPEMFRASYCPYLYGIKMVFIDMTVRELKASHPQKALRFQIDDPEFRRPLLHSYGYCIVHDVDIHDSYPESRPLRAAIWAAQDALGWDEDVVFHPYWENAAVKRMGDDIGRIMASAYTKSGKMILAVLNDTDEERKIELALDLEQLGMTPGLQGRDQWDLNQHYVLDEKWEDVVPPRGSRMILWDR